MSESPRLAHHLCDWRVVSPRRKTSLIDLRQHLEAERQPPDNFISRPIWQVLNISLSVPLETLVHSMDEDEDSINKINCAIIYYLVDVI